MSAHATTAITEKSRMIESGGRSILNVNKTFCRESVYDAESRTKVPKANMVVGPADRRQTASYRFASLRSPAKRVFATRFGADFGMITRVCEAPLQLSDVSQVLGVHIGNKEFSSICPDGVEHSIRPLRAVKKGHRL